MFEYSTTAIAGSAAAMLHWELQEIDDVLLDQTYGGARYTTFLSASMSRKVGTRPHVVYQLGMQVE